MTDQSQANPLFETSPRGAADYPLVELKQHLTLFVPDPPGPKTVQQVLDCYFTHWGDSFTQYYSTAFGYGPEPWDAAARARFYSAELPQLRQGVHWGYALSDGRVTDSRALVFHGYRPASQPAKASFFRFEFEWAADAQQLRAFAGDLLDIVSCLSGYGGYVFQRHASLLKSSYDQIYAWSRRYWGVEVVDLDVTVDYMRTAYKAVNWITIIGDPLAQAHSDALQRAKLAAHAFEVRSGGTLLTTGPVPLLGDRHRGRLTGYEAVALALQPMQVQDHAPFGDGTLSRWTEENTNAWLRRFTDPSGMPGSP
jgi:hypothetical protein